MATRMTGGKETKKKKKKKELVNEVYCTQTVRAKILRFVGNVDGIPFL